MQFNRAWLKWVCRERSARLNGSRLRVCCLALLAFGMLAAAPRGESQISARRASAAPSLPNESLPDESLPDESLPDEAGAPSSTQPSPSDSAIAAPLIATFSSSSQPVELPRFEERSSTQVVAPGERENRDGVSQELIIEGLVSYGNYKIFASGYDEKLFTGGIEYDRHSWGYFLHAQADYVAEFLPFVLLDKPLKTDIYGNPFPKSEKSIREKVPGVGFSPIGFRLQWRSGSRIKPYLEAKGGLIAFTKKVPSSEATYENFSLQSATGLQVRMTDRVGLRLGLFSDFHFSDDFIVPVNPGLDVMNANLGVSYHF